MEAWKDPITPFFWILGGSIIVLTLLVFIILYIKRYTERMETELEEKHQMQLEHQQLLLENSITIQEHERTRISANIHDDLIAQLHRIKLQNRDTELNTMINAGIKTARSISHDLTPPLIERLSLEELITDFVIPYRTSHDIDIRFYGSDQKEPNTIDKLHLFRIIQEVITNISKHAEADLISVGCRKSKNGLSLIISDNGTGIERHDRHGAGIKNIESRTQIIKGVFRYRKNKPGGTLFLIVIPHKK